MDDYSSRYSFEKKSVTPTPIVNEPQGIMDSRFKFNIPTKEIIKSYKLIPETRPVLMVPLRWNTKMNAWELVTSDSWMNASVDSNNYLNTHLRTAEQLPSSLTSNGNLKISVEESSIKQPVDKQAILRVQVVEDTTTLDANVTYTSPSIDTSNYSKFQGFVASDQDGTLYIDESADGSNWVQIDSKSVTGSSANPPVGVPFNEDVTAHYMRIRYVNGATAQNSFRLEVYTAVP